MKRYKMIQIPEDAYLAIKEYCQNNNKKMGLEVASLIYKHTNPTINKQPINVLRVDGKNTR
jgi:hypothetical protein